MTVIKLLRTLSEKNINIEVVDGELDLIVNDDNLTDDLIDHIRNKKIELIDYIQNAGRTKTSSDFSLDELKQKDLKAFFEDNGIDSFNVQDMYKLTPLQEGFIFHYLMDKDSLAFFEQTFIDLTGKLDLEAFNSGWQEIGKRYDVLRTMFVTDFQVPVQVVLKTREVGFSYIDIRDEENKEACINNIKEEDRRDTFDLKNDLLFRVKVVHIEDNKYTIILSFHHIILDGWCTSILFSEFLECYKSIINNKEMPKVVPPSYSTYIKWLNKRDKDESRDYWKNYLKGYEELATIQGGSLETLSNGDEQSTFFFTLNKEQTSLITDLSKELGVTLNTFIQTVWGIILASYNDKNDVVFGATVSGRPQEIPRIEEMVGLFINTIPVRIEANRKESFKEVVTRIQKEAIESMAYHHSSLAQTQTDSGLNNNLLNHVMVFENFPIKESGFNEELGLKIDSVEGFEQTNYDFCITVLPSDQIGFRLTYNPHNYSDDTIKRISSHIENIICDVISNCNILIGDIDPIGKNEYELLDGFNNTKTDFNQEKTIVDLFEEQVKRTPDNIAIIFENEELTYKELNEKSNKLANYLIKNVKAGTSVAVLMESSINSIIAILSIIKCGNSYLAIDSSTPKDRIAYMLNDAGISNVITTDNLINLVPVKGINTICIDKEWSCIEKENSRNLEQSLTDDKLYIIYTSGSTGKPKGVVGLNKGMVNRLNWGWNNYPFKANEMCCHKTSLNFVDHIAEIFSPLLKGIPLVVIPEAKRKNVIEMVNELISNKITRITLVPSLLRVILEMPEEAIYKLQSLKNIFCSGEELPRDLAQLFYNKFQDSKLVNIYGSSEVSADVIAATVENPKATDTVKWSVPIGSPISNIKAYILSSNSKPSPVGVKGMLYISGYGLSSGYLNRPELTEEKFVENPFKPGEKMYNTGDLARWLPDGNIEFLGRIDNQVKIRGYRIELGEIENSLIDIDVIKSAVVLAKKDKNRSIVLAGYYLSDYDVELSELREKLSKVLPDYMIPSFFIKMDEFPYTSTGKVDRKAFPDLDKCGVTSNLYVEASTETEKILVGIWKDVLGLERVGIMDNFFETGGNSLTAITLINSIDKAIGIKLALPMLFKKPTIKLLAEELHEDNKETVSFPDLIIDRQNIYDPFPMTDVQQAYWVGRGDHFDLGGVGTHGYNEMFFDNLDPERVEYSINYLIQRHDMLRMVVTPNGKQRILKEYLYYKVQVIDLSNKTEDEEYLSLMEQRNELSHQVFTGEAWPLFDFRILKFRNGAYKLLSSIDFLIFDAASTIIFYNELIQVYLGQEELLPNFDINFRDYIMTELALKETTIFAQSENYWLERIPSLPLAPDLPLIKSPKEIENTKFTKQRMELSKNIWSKLQKKIQQNGITPTVFLTECLGNVLRRWSKSDHFLINMTLFNRNPYHKDVNSILGDFTSLTLLEMDYRDNKTFKEQLKRTQGQLWEDLENKYFSGVEVQRKMSALAGETVTMPIVITSVLGLGENYESKDLAQLKASESSNRTKVHEEYTISQTPQVWIDCQIGELDGKLILDWDSLEELFPTGMLKEMFTALEKLLLYYAEDFSNWNQPVSTLIPKKDLDIRTDVNNTSAEISNKYMHELFVDSVKKYSSKVAVKSSSKKIDYLELYNYSSSLGLVLEKNGAKPNELIGVLMHKGWEQVVATLGIQLSGAAYMPIDASLPLDRINKLIEIGDVSKVVTVSNVIDELQLDKDIDIFCVDKLEVSTNEEITFTAKQSIEDLAYIIFTSGSTGEPKGVMIDHRGAVNTILDVNNRFNITENDSCFALSSLSFDLSVYDIFGLLAAGGTVVIPGKDEGKDPEAWIKYLKNDCVTVWNSVPALMQMLVEYTGGNETLGLKHVFLSGDWIPVSLPKQIEKMNPGVEVISLGGATEASIWSIFYPIKDVDPSWKSIPYGKPLLNQSFHVLKKDLSPCPQWVSGDLYIGGIGLALGYWKDKDKTESSFVINPGTGERLYRTGDQGRYLPDGNIEFLGRDDDQVKVQGYRIELGEIEEALKCHQMIENAVVDARSFGANRANGKQLIAYIQTDSNQDLSDTLKEFLGKKLPSYMVPLYFIKIDSVPLSVNGKINRKALPDPDGVSEASTTEFVEAETEIEKKLVEIWKEILDLEKIGIMDNFFESGGNSLTAITLINSIDKAIGVKLSLPLLFKKPTIQLLAKELTVNNNKQISLPELIVDKDNLYEPFSMTDVQQAYWVGRGDHFDLGGVGTHTYTEMHVPELDVKKLEYSINCLINRHEMLKMVVTPNGKQKFLNEDLYYKVECIDFTNSTELEEINSFIEQRDELSHQVFTGETWPLFEFRTVKFRDGSYKILSSMDSLIFDAASSMIFWTEVLEIYKGKEESLPKLSLNFRDYILTEQSLRDTDIYRDSEIYWLNRIPKLPAGPDLPLLKSPKELDETVFTKQSMVLSRNTWNTLKDKIKQIGITPTVFLTECFGQVLRKWSKSDHFLINMTLFNRIPFHKDVNSILGDFTSLTLLEMDYRENMSFEDQLKRTQGQLWEDLENKYFSGVEVQRKMSTTAGETITIPIVFTSTLGVGEESQDEESVEMETDKDNLSEIQKNYSISQTPQVWIDCQIGEVYGELHLDWDSVIELFPDGMLKKMFNALENLLNYYAKESSDWSQNAIDIIPKNELEKRAEANNTDSEISSKYMHELFVDSVLKNNDKVAVRTTGKSLTYKELYGYSSVLGKELEKVGAKPNELVAVLMNKGWEQVVATLGIQFSGAAYMPIDASLPLDRINKLIEIGDVTKVVTVSSVIDGLQLDKYVDVICVDELEFSEIEAKSITFTAKQKISDLAYIIFTSGSTGEPKGVMIDHRGAVNTILDVNSRFNITDKDSCFALSSLSFDLSVYDIFGLLAVGGTIVIPGKDEGKDPETWLKYLRRDGVTVWNSVPALMQMFIEYWQGNERNLGLEKVLLSGDWIPVSLPDQIKEINPKVNVISLGGATEASIWSIFYPINSVESEWKSIPYGKPLLNQSFHVLKKDMSPCPQWVPGDLYIGGIGLALGYWKDKDKTESSFVIHPKTGERLYRTGDQGRYLPDGNIEFLGRDDSQVKVQGYRIELGEIEEALKSHQMIENAVVDARSFGAKNKGKQLIAYIIPNKDDEIEDDVEVLDETEEYDNYISDYNDRAIYTLEQHNIRDFDKEFISLENESKDIITVSKDIINCEITSDEISFDNFCSMLQCLTYEVLDEQPLPKYLYISFGNLYSVQTYLYIGENSVQGIEGGYYYYSPKDNGLYKINSLAGDKKQGNGIQLYLVSDLSVLKPMYVDKSNDFAALEAGYMGQLLTNALPENLGIKNNNTNDIDRVSFELKTEHKLLKSYTIGISENIEINSKKASVKTVQSFIANKIYRSFDGLGIKQADFLDILKNSIITKDLEVFLLLKEDKIDGLVAGIYKYSLEDNKLGLVKDEIDSNIIFSGNYGTIFDKSGFTIFFTAAKKEDQYRDNLLGLAGSTGQDLMNISIEKNIGICPVGNIDKKAAIRTLGLDGSYEILHTLVGGKVTDEQKNSIAVVTREKDPSEVLKEYLGTLLPSYMVPTYFMLIESVPLTGNGKVNRKSLPDPDNIIANSSNEHVEPETEVEVKLVEIWKSILGINKIGTLDNFFELGGNSLTAITMTNRIEQDMEVSVSLTVLFQKPTIKELSEELSLLSKKETSLPALIVDKENYYEPFPMTDVQQAYWIGQKEGYSLGGVGSHVYDERFFKNLDVERLEYSINYLIKRHEMLRMVVTPDGKQKFLKDDLYFKLPFIDLSDKSKEEEEKLFMEQRVELSHQTFNAECWPLYDFRVVKFRNGTFKINSSFDLVAMDAASMMILWNELFIVYTGNEDKLPKLSLNFRDYVITEYSIRETNIFDDSKKYWLDRIPNLPLAPDLPLVKSPEEVKETKFNRRHLVLSKKIWSALQGKIKKLGVTPTVFMIQCVGEVLRKWSKTDHFTLNLTLFNRLPFHEDVNSIIGDFTSLTLLEMDYRGTNTFADMLTNIQSRLWKDLENKYFSGVEVQREMSAIAGETITMPVVITSTLGVGSGEHAEINEDLVTVEDTNKSELHEEYSISQTPQVWIDCQITESNGKLNLNWDAVEELFPFGMLNEMFTALENLLKYYAEDSSAWNQPVIDLIPKKEFEIREDANATDSEISSKYMHELFVDSVIENSDNVAVKTIDKSLTYKELYNYSFALGLELEKAGAKPNELIAVLMHKGWEQVVATLGIQFSGAAYMPIDASLPLDRINKLIEIGDVSKVVTVSNVIGELQLDKDVDVICVDELEVSEVRTKSITFTAKQKITDLAYIIFTSGSTGEPKGVMIDHRGAVNTILDVNSRFNITENDSCFALSSLSFDLSVYDIFGLLAAGGTVVIPGKDEGKDPETWLKYLKNDAVTVWNSVPALMQMLVEYTGGNETLGLKHVLLSGDWIPVSLPEQIENMNPGVDVISLGGATEASIWSIFYPIKGVDPSWKSIPYGKPLLNQNFHVLKKDMSPCPQWVPGDLYIGGIGLALGYWKDKEKTESSFVNHPKTGERLYRTGDQGRYLPDGNIEFLGRDDSQVKVQGYRIELGEIEEALKSHQMIENAVVDARSFGAKNKGKQLVAYIQPKEDDTDNVGGLESAGNSIVDKAERAAFKLEKKGILKLSGDSVQLNLQEDKLTLNSKGEFDFTGDKLTFDNFSRVFNCLVNRTFEEQPLPKYYYPSAGNLYPVQTYVSIPENSVEGMDPGYYYFNPEENCFYLTSELKVKFPDNGTFGIYFIADLDAIEPLYGRFAEDFSYMEAGYMAKLLMDSAPLDIGVKESDLSGNITDKFNLKDSHRVLSTYICGSIKASKVNNSNPEMKLGLIERKSYRSFGKDIITSTSFTNMLNSLSDLKLEEVKNNDKVTTYVTVKAGRVENLEGGIYKLDTNTMELVKCGEEAELYALLSGSEGMYQESGFGIFVTGKPEKSGMYRSGVIGQALMNASTKGNIGLCAIGIVNQVEGIDIFNLNNNDEVLHSFLGGYVTDEQINTFTSEIKVSNPSDLLKEYLGELLPSYMVPNYFMLMESVPLTANGKVNRKSLPDPDGANEVSTTEFVEAETDTEKKLVETWKEILGLEKIGVLDDFFELGGNSLSAIKAASLAGQKDIHIKIQDLYNYRTIRELTRHLNIVDEYMPEYFVENIIDEEKLNIPNEFIKSDFKNILLLGSTGFLGIHLLRDFILETDSTITCIVRAKDDNNALERLKEKIIYYFPEKSDLFLLEERVNVIAGDISKEKLDVSDSYYKYLADKVDLVVNAAANVKHIGDYDVFYKANVETVKNIIDLCLVNDKLLLHVSTKSIFENIPLTEGIDAYTEQHLCQGSGTKNHVYLRSKIEAEELINNNKKKGLRSIIYRVGTLTGRRTDGKFQENISDNGFYNRLKLIVETGALPKEMQNIGYEFSPVDDTSISIIKTACLKESINRVFHIFNDKTIKLKDIVKYIEPLFTIKSVTWGEFTLLLEDMKIKGDTTAQRLLLDGDTGESNFDVISNEFSNSYLRKCGFEWKAIDNEYITKVFEYMKIKSFITQ